MAMHSATAGPRGAASRVPRVYASAAPSLAHPDGADRLTLRDLSHTGCAAESHRQFTPGSDVYLTFAIDDGCLSFAVPVQVACCREINDARTSTARHLVGFEFSVARQPGIHRIVEILLESMGQPLGVH